MIPNMCVMTRAWYFKRMLFCMICMGVAGCALWSKTPPQKTISRPHAVERSQQQYYDHGLEQYSRENYGDAKAAFEHVVELDPNTALGVKARENLKKIERILKTLEEIEAR